MRRRRQKNNLLPKMIGLAVLINAILLPILAQFGVFKNIGHGQRLTPIELVKAPPPEKRPPPPKQVAKARPPGRKAAPRTASARRAAPGPPPVRVVAAGGGAGGSGNGGDAGITTSDDKTPIPPAPSPGGAEQTAPAATPAPVPATPPPAPVTPPVPTKPAPPPAPHVPVITAAAPVAQPRPAIPDDLRDADLNAAFEGLFTVRADGTATVKMVSSTGNPALDGLALDAARRWTFRPATRDGQPVESYLRLRVEFDVSS